MYKLIRSPPNNKSNIRVLSNVRNLQLKGEFENGSPCSINQTNLSIKQPIFFSQNHDIVTVNQSS